MSIKQLKEFLEDKDLVQIYSSLIKDSNDQLAKKLSSLLGHEEDFDKLYLSILETIYK